MSTKVLVFEQDTNFANDLSEEFTAMGCKVETVGDGNAGLTMAMRDRPDLIVLTIELSGLNGFSVCIRLKEHPALKSVPVILLSSTATQEALETHQRHPHHADAYFHKPVSVFEVLARAKGLVPSIGEEDVTAERLDELVRDDELEPIEELEEYVAPAPSHRDPIAAGIMRGEDVDALADQAFENLMSAPPAAPAATSRPKTVPPPPPKVPMAASHPPRPAALPVDANAIKRDPAKLSLSRPPPSLQSRAEAPKSVAARPPVIPVRPTSEPSRPPETTKPTTGDTPKPHAEIHAYVAEEKAPSSNRMKTEHANESKPTNDVAPNLRHSSIPPAKQQAHEGSAESAERESAKLRLQQAHHEAQRDAAELTSLKAARDTLQTEVTALNGEVTALKSELADAKVHQNMFAASEHEREHLEKELAELKVKLASVASTPSAAAAPTAGKATTREFLELKDTLNKKDKELLALREQVNVNEKTTLDLRDKLIAFERTNVDLEEQLATAHGEIEGLRGALESKTTEATGLGEQISHLSIELDGEKQALAREREARAIEGQSFEAQIVELKAKSEASLAQAQADADARLAAMEQQAADDKAHALAQQLTHLDAKNEAALAEAHHAHEQALADLANVKEHEKATAIEELNRAREEALEASRLEHEIQMKQGLDDLADKNHAELEALERRKSEALANLGAELETQKTNALDALRADLEQQKAEALAALRAELEKQNADALDALRAELEKQNADALVALGAEKDSERASAIASQAHEHEHAISEFVTAKEEDKRLALEALKSELETAMETLRGEHATATAELQAKLASEIAERDAQLANAQATISERDARLQRNRESLERAKDALADALLAIEATENS